MCGWIARGRLSRVAEAARRRRALGGLWAGSAGATSLEHSIAVCSASTAGSVGACSGFCLFWDPGQGDGRLLRLM